MALVCEELKGEVYLYRRRAGWRSLCVRSLITFHLCAGTSAGAQNLSAYLCSQPGYGRKVDMRYTTGRGVRSRATICTRRNLGLDLDWLVESTTARMPLQMDTAARLFDNRKIAFICAPAGG